MPEFLPSESEWPFISILVMAHNLEHFIGPCLDSVFAQAYEGRAEIIVCDDASTDATWERICEKAEAYSGSFPLITHRCPVNGGVAANMNAAVLLSHGDWLMRVDGDDVLHPDRLRLTALAIARHPHATAIAGQRSTFTDCITPATNPADEELSFSFWNRRDFDAEGTLRHGGLEWWGCVMSFTRRIFTEFGDMPPVCAVLDDTMFATRALMLGDFVIITNATLLYYRRHSGNVSSGRIHGRRGLLAHLRDDAASRDYYRRGLPCHEPILRELEMYAGTHDDCRGLLEHFRKRFAELRRQALFWEKPWRERIADGRVGGQRSLLWALRTSCPLAYALGSWLRQAAFFRRG